MFDSVLNMPLELLTIFAKSSILDAQLCSEYTPRELLPIFAKGLEAATEGVL